MLYTEPHRHIAHNRRSHRSMFTPMYLCFYVVQIPREVEKIKCRQLNFDNLTKSYTDKNIHHAKFKATLFTGCMHYSNSKH